MRGRGHAPRKRRARKAAQKERRAHRLGIAPIFPSGVVLQAPEASSELVKGDRMSVVWSR